MKHLKKISDDTESLCQTLINMGEMIAEDINNVCSNVEAYDQELAALFGGGGNGYTSGGERSISSLSTLTRQNKKDESSFSNAVSKITKKVTRIEATKTSITFGLVEGLGEFAEAIVDTAAILRTSANTPKSWLVDKILGTNKTEEMGNKTQAFVSTKHVREHLINSMKKLQ